ncbi:MAG: hypothetical protein P8Y75_03080 [Nitrospirota bacterium]|jgi:hypothetical protein
MNASTLEGRDEETAFIVRELGKGTSQAIIIQKLAEDGMHASEATQLVQNVRREVMTALEDERPSGVSLATALVGGLVAALAGGILWSVVVALTDYEIGYMAWGIGLLTGSAVVLFSGRKKGLALQVMAVSFSAAGIALGKYLTFHHFVREAIIQKYGAEAAAGFTPLSAAAMSAFFGALGSLVSGYDFLWIGLAVVTAWKMPKGLGVKAA